MKQSNPPMTQEREEEMERHNAMLVDALNSVMREFPEDFDKARAAINATSAQSSAWLNKKHVEWLDSLDGKWCVMSLERGAGLFPVDYHLREPNKYIRIYAIPSDKE